MFRTSTDSNKEEELTLAFREIDAPEPAAAMPEREDRLPRFLAARKNAGEELARVGIAVIGAGAIGRNIALHASRLNVGRLLIADPDHIAPENLLTQPVSPDDLGQPKAENLARLCKSISPRTSIRAYGGRVEQLETTALAEADLIVLATDNLHAEVEVGQRCLYLQQPLVQAAVHGDTLTAQVRFFGNRGPDAPCPACGFNEDEWSHLNRQTRFSCDGVLRDRPAAEIDAPPTRSVSALCSLAADLAVLQILRFTIGLGHPVGDVLLEYNGFTHRTVTTPLARRLDCPADHTPWVAGRTPRPLADCTPRELVEAAGFGADEAGLWQVAVTVGELQYVQRGICRGWHERPVERFVPRGRDAGRCPACGDPLVAQPFHAHRPVSGAMLQPVLDSPLCEISAAMPRWAVIRRGERAVLFRAGEGDG